MTDDALDPSLLACDHGHAPPHCPIVGCSASRPAIPLIEWKKADAEPREPAGYEGVEHTSEAIEAHRELEKLAKRDNASGDMTRGKGNAGWREDGTKAPGAADWPYRPPVHADQLDPAHEYIPIILANPNNEGDPVTLMYQQAPPIGNVPGAVYGSAKEQRRNAKVRQVSEAQAKLLADAFERTPRATIAAVAGVSRHQLRRAITRRNKGA